MNSCYDLHIHSKHSDGILTTYELVQRVKNAGLVGFALTDHDTVEGIQEAIEFGKKFGISVIPGIELTTYYNKSEVHLLGYFLDYTSDKLNAFLLKFRNNRFERMKKMVEKINALGLDVSFDEVIRLTNGSNVGRPHLARVLVAKGYVKDISEAFEKYIGEHAPAYVPRMRITVKEGVELINSVGGVPIIAHPLLIKNFSLDFLSFSHSLGVKGFEVVYPYESKNKNIDPQLNEKIKEYCTTHNLIMTGGTDFHSPTESVRIGSKCVNSLVVESLYRLSKNSI